MTHEQRRQHGLALFPQFSMDTVSVKLRAAGYRVDLLNPTPPGDAKRYSVTFPIAGDNLQKAIDTIVGMARGEGCTSTVHQMTSQWADRDLGKLWKIDALFS